MPVSELAQAYGAKASDLHGEKQGIEQYLASHASITSTDGSRWSSQVDDLVLAPQASMPEYILTLEFSNPKVSTWSDLQLHFDAVGEKISTHQTDVWLRSDSLADPPLKKPILVKTLREGNRDAHLHRDPPTVWSSFKTTLIKGANHIKEGTDHLLFLLALLLPAPLLAKGWKWSGYAGGKVALSRILKVVTAFTVGHSITLAIGAMGFAHFKGAFIESAIAVSIFVSAIHAFVPIFRGKEVWIAGVFGLVHGLSFATALSEYGFDSVSLVTCLLGFNLGIELFQMLVILVTIPWLILLAKTKLYTPFRLIGATITAIAAGSWFLERAFGTANPIGPYVELAAAHAVWIVFALAIASFAGSRLSNPLGSNH